MSLPSTFITKLADYLDDLRIVRRGDARGLKLRPSSHLPHAADLVRITHATRQIVGEAGRSNALVPWLSSCFQLNRSACVALHCSGHNLTLALGETPADDVGDRILGALRVHSAMVRGEGLSVETLGRDLNRFAFGTSLYGHPTPPEDAAKATTPLSALLRAHHAQNWCLMVRLEPVTSHQLAPLAEYLRHTNEPLGIQHYQGNSQQISRDPEISRLEELLELWLERLETARTEGLWLPKVNVYAGTQEKADEIAASLASVLGTSQLFPMQILRATEEPAQWKGNLKPDFLSHPDRPYRNAILTSEAAYLLDFPREEYGGYTLLPDCRFGVGAEVDDAGSPDTIPLGMVLDRGIATSNELRFPLDQFPRHALITGLTGSGKTNTCRHILDQVHQSSQGCIPFLIIEPAKDEYHDWIETFPAETRNIFGIGDKSATPLRLNPFVPGVGFPIQGHIDYVCQLFQASFSLFGPQPYVLFSAIHDAYTAEGWNLDTGLFDFNRSGSAEIRYPTIGTLLEAIKGRVEETNYSNEFKGNLIAALHGRIGRLIEGGAKKEAYNAEVSIPEEELFEKICLIKLTGVVSDDEKAFLMGLLFIRLYEYHEVKSKNQDGKLKHITLIEEAHRLFRRVSGGTAGEDANPRALSVEIFTNLLAEIRAYGESILLAEQIPQKLVSDAIKNTNLKIAHRIVHREDRQLIGDSINLTPEQVQELGLLKTGEAVVHFQGLPSAAHLQVCEMVPPGPSQSRGDHSSSDDAESLIRKAIYQRMMKETAQAEETGPQKKSPPGEVQSPMVLRARCASLGYWTWLRFMSAQEPAAFAAQMSTARRLDAHLEFLEQLELNILDLYHRPGTPEVQKLITDIRAMTARALYGDLPSPATLAGLQLKIMAAAAQETQCPVCASAGPAARCAIGSRGLRSQRPMEAKEIRDFAAHRILSGLQAPPFVDKVAACLLANHLKAKKLPDDEIQAQVKAAGFI